MPNPAICSRSGKSGGYFEGSLARLKQEIAERAGSIEDERWGKLRHSYREDSFDLYERLNRLFSPGPSPSA